MMYLLARVAAEADARGLDPDIVKPGWTALGVVTLLGVATFFLSRSFIKHTRKAKEPWPDEPTNEPPSA